MKVQIVDPPAYTPPYDRSLCAALALFARDKGLGVLERECVAGLERTLID